MTYDIYMLYMYVEVLARGEKKNIKAMVELISTKTQQKEKDKRAETKEKTKVTGRIELNAVQKYM